MFLQPHFFFCGAAVIFFLFIFSGKIYSTVGSSQPSTDAVAATIFSVKAPAENPNLVPGIFTCDILNRKPAYCPGQVYTWKLTATNATLVNPDKRDARLNCEVLVAGSVGKEYTGGSCYPSPHEQRQPVADFLARGGTNSFIVPSTGYKGNQRLVLLIYYDNFGPATNNNVDVNCPIFSISADCSTTATTSTSTSTFTSSSTRTTSTSTTFATTIITDPPRPTSTYTSATTSLVSSAISKHNDSLLFILLASLYWFLH